MSIVIHAFPPSPRAFKLLFAANQLGIDYTFKLVDLGKGEAKTPEFTALNINQRMPVLEDDGYVLWESNAILEYLASKKPESGLIPSDFQSRQQVTKWLYWESAHWDQTAAVFMFERVVKLLFNMGPASESEIARGTTMANRIAPVLDKQLQKHRYITGETLSVADIAIAAPFCHAKGAKFPFEDYRAIQRWISDVQSLPAWGKTIAMQTGPA